MKISEKKALETYPKFLDSLDKVSAIQRQTYIQGYDQATKDVLEWIEKNIPYGEMSHGIVLDVIQECKLYFEGEV